MKSPKALILYHGAGSNKDNKTLVHLDKGLEINVFRFNFPYRDKKPVGPAGPNSMSVLVSTIETQFNQVANDLGLDSSEIVIGGRSLGGRACSVAVAQGLSVGGLLLLSYPLHPPGKPDKLRIDHFPNIGVPTLFVQGKSDPFGKPHELDEHLPAIVGKAEIQRVDGSHDPKDLNKIGNIVSNWLGLNDIKDP